MGAGKGKKYCTNPDCKAINGSRKIQCWSCGTGFKVKGKQYKDLNIYNVKYEDTKRPNFPAPILQQILDLIELHNSKDEIERRKKYRSEGTTWQSKDGKYRIRYTKTFMGVNFEEGYDNNFMLLVRNRSGWDVVSSKKYGELRFVDLVEAILGMIKHKGNTNELEK